MSRSPAWSAGTESHRLRAVLEGLWSRPWNVVGVTVLRSVLGLVLVYKFITEVRFCEIIYGHLGVVGSLHPELSVVIPYSIVACYLVGGLGLLFGGKFTRLATLIAFLGVYGAESVTNVLDGGDNVLRLILMYMLLLSSVPSREGASPWGKTLIHNVGVGLIYMQLIVLYTTSATMKLQGEEWVNGTAAYYVMQLQWFRPEGLGFLQEWIKDPYLCAVATYSALLYQLWYPMSLVGRAHLPWTAFGIVFHLGMAVFLGLVTFSAIMIGLIVFAITDREYAHLVEFGDRVKTWLRRPRKPTPNEGRLVEQYE